jgi:hypothetical protein
MLFVEVLSTFSKHCICRLQGELQYVPERWKNFNKRFISSSKADIIVIMTSFLCFSQPSEANAEIFIMT